MYLSRSPESSTPFLILCLFALPTLQGSSNDGPLTCTPSAVMPDLAACHFLVQSLVIVAGRAGGSDAIRWGPNTGESGVTAPTPQAIQLSQQIEGRFEEWLNCEFHIGFSALPELPPFDEFSILDLAGMGSRLTWQCLTSQSSTGYGCPGRYRTVTQYLRRYTPPYGSSVSGASQNLSRPGQVLRTWDITLHNQAYKLYEVTTSNTLSQPGRTLNMTTE